MMPMLRALVLAALAATPPLSGAAGQSARAVQEFATLDDHDPTRFAYALRYGSDLVKRVDGSRFTLLLGGRAVLLVVPGSNIAQRDVPKWRAGTGGRLAIIACRETMARLRESAGVQVPVLPGVSIEPCEGRPNSMLAAGWQRMLGM